MLPYQLTIIISKEFIQDKQLIIIKNSKEKESFINKLKNEVGNINTADIPDSNLLERIVQEFTFITENLWNKYFKHIKITKCSKAWLNEECSRELNAYHTFKSIEAIQFNRHSYIKLENL